jgi:hypothetical protein
MNSLLGRSINFEGDEMEFQSPHELPTAEVHIEV